MALENMVLEKLKKYEVQSCDAYILLPVLDVGDKSRRQHQLPGTNMKYQNMQYQCLNHRRDYKDIKEYLLNLR